MLEALRECDVMINGHDYNSMHESVTGYYINPIQRYRIFLTGPLHIFRIEVSDSVLNLQFDSNFIPKL